MAVSSLQGLQKFIHSTANAVLLFFTKKTRLFFHYTPEELYKKIISGLITLKLFSCMIMKSVGFYCYSCKRKPINSVKVQLCVKFIIYFP